MFSKACEYAIRASIYIALKSQDGKRTSLKDIANETGSPVAFTAKILQKLSKSNIVNSVQGATGGFEINKNALKEIKISAIVTAIDGDLILTSCGLGLDECSSDKPCPIHESYASIRNDLNKLLNSTSLYDLATGLENGLTFLKR